MITELNNALKGMILSASGWRGVFAEDGNEESSTPEISFWHSLIAAAAAKVFSGYLKDKSLNNGAIIVGMDTRPTGKAIASAVIKALLGQGREAWFTGIAAAPEIMAFARLNNASVSGFIYISASHNPIGHNGIKFGLTDGGVLQGSETAKLVTSFNSIVANETEINVLTGYLNNTDPKKLNAVYNDEEKHKKSAINAYRDFTAEVISGFDEIEKISLFFDSIRRGLKERPLGIAADLNGSARALSIDRDFLKSLGASYYCINDVPGKIAHRIVPEGESLEPCRAFLEELHRKDPSVILGYMPDCDGDRGNLVIWDDKRQCSRSLEAQEVFALACMAELSSLAYTGQLKNSKAAIAVNDPTSLRIDKICRAFGVKVFRAEVGEANVVGLARKLRGEGYLVRILGEGSAGGTITHPSAVRDPIDTLGAILKLLAIRKGSGEGYGGMGLFRIWCELSSQSGIYSDDFTLGGIIASLPPFVTTGAYSEDALLKVKTTDHGLLKERYQKIFLRQWEDKKAMLKEKYGIISWEASAYNGTEEKKQIINFAEAGRGGLKIEFFKSTEERQDDAKIACIWMRGSGTEPVFRVMADTEGSDPGLERFLIKWQREMTVEADSAN